MPAKPFASLDDEVREFQRIVFAAVGRIGGASDRHNTSTVSAYRITLPRWIASSAVDIELHGTSDDERLERIAHFKYSRGRDRADQIWYAPRVFGMKEDPKIEVDRKSGAARIEGFVSSLRPGGIAEGVENFFEWVGLTDEKNGRIYLKDIRMTVSYTPDVENMPQITQSLTDWSIRSAA